MLGEHHADGAALHLEDGMNTVVRGRFFLPVPKGLEASAPPAGLDQEPEIVEVLVPDQFLQPDKMRCQKLAPKPESFCFPTFLCGRETDAVYAVQEVHTVRWAAEMEHLAFPRRTSAFSIPGTVPPQNS
jgi:hypothetical protein